MSSDAAPADHAIASGWQLAPAEPGLTPDPGVLEALAWSPAAVPGTVAGAGFTEAIEERDWWFRARFAAPPAAGDEEVVLVLGGIATVADVYLNGEHALHSESMFAGHEIDAGGRLRDDNELVICCRALAPRLRERRRPRARWRTRLVSEGNLRFVRTMLLGRAPGFAPGPPVVGPWRPVCLRRRRGVILEGVRLRARLDGADGRLECRGSARRVAGSRLPATVSVSVGRPGMEPGAEAELAVEPATGAFAGTVTAPDVAPWWPHTHGRPVLYDVALSVDGEVRHRARVGFRRLETPADLEPGLELRINGEAVFVRGAVWTPLDLTAPHAAPEELRRVLGHVVDAGMNMLRLPGTGAYESDAFHDLCDELGILVWQDFAFANLDYPESDPAFLEAVRAEARGVLDRLGGRPSLAVLCGGSEVAQQVAMLGLDPGLADGPLYGELLPSLVAEAEVDAPYVPSAPWGGELPFRPDRGVANYYGVGGYRRPLHDARLAGVRFAAESLAFANVPDEDALAAIAAPGGLSVTHPAWKAGVPRDAGAGWDFDDVRDHYLSEVFGVDPVALRAVDQDRYLELSRAVTGEVMAETFGEWRRPGSPCRGALVLWLKDLYPGAGWGLLDHRGEPKAALHHLRRALAPVAVWTTDEALGGIDVHIANDGGRTLEARLRVALYRDFAIAVQEAVRDVALVPHAAQTLSVEGLLGRFVDVAWAYRFGPPAQDLIVATLEGPGGEIISQSFRYPAGRPLAAAGADDLGLRGRVEPRGAGGWGLRVTSRRFAYGVRVTVPGCRPADDAFGVEPGHERVIALHGAPTGEPGALSALNLRGRVRVQGLESDPPPSG